MKKEKWESQADWKAAEDLRGRRVTEVFQVCILENGIHLVFVSAVGVTDAIDCSTVI